MVCATSSLPVPDSPRISIEAGVGAADYVVKPDDPEGLGEIALDSAIKQAIERSRLVNELTDLRRHPARADRE